LHDVSSRVPFIGVRIEGLLITVKLIHSGEVSIADTHDDDSQGVIRASDNLVDRLAHVINHTISDDQKHLELLIVVVAWISLTDIVDSVEDRTEVGGAVQVDIGQIVLVVLYNFFQVVDSGVEDVTVHGEAVRCSLGVWRNTAAEAEQVDSLVSVVILENSTHLVDNLKVLVTRHVKVMEGFG